jgi:hypothetical protein
VRRAGALAAVALATLLAPPAQASPEMETLLMDDAEIVYSKPDHLDRRLAEIKALGVDRVRVSVYWRLLAPQPEKQERPPAGQYPTSDPRFYGQSKWDRYDRIVALANKHGLGVLFSLTAPAPLWATGKPEGGRDDVEETWDPSAPDFRDFAAAVGTRYSGSWRDESEQPALVPLLPPQKTMSEPLPRVGMWSIWNEPNQGGWLTPQWRQDPSGKRLIPASPRIYRALADAGVAALRATGHEGDQILLGETAPRGHKYPALTHGVRPLRFLRELFCVDGQFRPFSGDAAKVRDCPEAPDPAAFVQAHPGLFAVTGFAHHPYSLYTPPRARDLSSDDAALAGTSRLTATLDHAYAAWGQGQKLPIWMTEYGYQTDPPDATIGVSWARQADWIDDATYLAYRNPRVASMAQFLLVDDGPLRQFPASDPRHWGTFQSGLMTNDGKKKPSYTSFQRPVTVTPRRQRRGRSFRIFGQLRSAPDGEAQQAAVQFRARGRKQWTTTGTVAVANPRGFFDTAVKASRSGSYRILWNGKTASRAVAVTTTR